MTELEMEVRDILEKLYNDSLEDTAYNTNHEGNNIKYATAKILSLVAREVEKAEAQAAIDELEGNSKKKEMVDKMKKKGIFGRLK